MWCFIILLYFFYCIVLSQGRIQCKTNLIKKRIVDNTVCDVCHAAEETAAHVIFGCTAAHQFWDALQIETQADRPIQKLQDTVKPGHIPSKHFGTFSMICSWHIWKRRNNTVFRDDRTTLTATLSACKSEAALWKARLPKKDMEVADAWCSILTKHVANIVFRIFGFQNHSQYNSRWRILARPSSTYQKTKKGWNLYFPFLWHARSIRSAAQTGQYKHIND